MVPGPMLTAYVCPYQATHNETSDHWMLYITFNIRKQYTYSLIYRDKESAASLQDI